MDSQLLLEKKMAAVARRAFAPLGVVCQLCPVLDSAVLHLDIHARKLQLMQNAGAQAILGTQRRVHATLCSVNYTRHQFASGSNKSLHCIGRGYQQNQLCPTTSACPVCSSREGILQIPSVKNFDWWRSRKDFAAAAAPILATHKQGKTWLCDLAWETWPTQL